MEGQENAAGSIIEVRVAATRLVCRDACVRLLVKPPGKDWEVFGQTEVMTGESSPSFLHAFRLPYIFQELQHLRFDVVESGGDAGAEQKVLGSVTTTLGDLAGSGGKVTRDLGHGMALKLFAEESVESNATCHIFISCAKLDKTVSPLCVCVHLLSDVRICLASRIRSSSSADRWRAPSSVQCTRVPCSARRWTPSLSPSSFR